MGMGIVCLSAVTDPIGKNWDRWINSGAENVKGLQQVLDGLPSSKCAGLWQFWDKSEQAVMIQITKPFQIIQMSMAPNSPRLIPPTQRK